MMRRELWGYLGLDLLQGRIGVAGIEVREGGLRAVEQAAGALERDDGVLECRLF